MAEYFIIYYLNYLQVLYKYTKNSYCNLQVFFMQRMPECNEQKIMIQKWRIIVLKNKSTYENY